MKHLVFAMFLVFSMTSLFAQLTFQGNLGIDFPGVQKYESDGYDSDADTNLGISPSFEVLYPAMPNLLVGGGLEYQILRGYDESGEGDPAYGFIPIFLSGKYAIPMEAQITPEILLQFGYNFLTANDDLKGDGDLSGGIYFGIGAGIVHPMGFTADIMYRMSKGGTEGDEEIYDPWNDEWYTYSYDTDVTQGNLTLRLGYRF